MKTCLICGKEIKNDGGIFFDGYWFDDVQCVQVYCVFMEIEYAQPVKTFIEAA